MDSIKKILILSLFVLSSARAFEGKAQKLAKKEFNVCGKKLSLEMAKSESQRSTGLMHRDSVPAGTGMLFVFEAPQVLNFWMRNVPMAIDIGYFDVKGKLLNAMTMEGTSPLMKDEALPRYASAGAALYAVEAEVGFFKTVKTKGCKLSPLP